MFLSLLTKKCNNMKTLFENWNKFINEDKDPRYVQKIYQVMAKIRISKYKGGDREQSFNEVRGIPDVTVVSVDPIGTGHDENYYYSTLIIKFELIGNSNPMVYKEQVLLPGLRAIKGLEVRYVGDVKEYGQN